MPPAVLVDAEPVPPDRPAGEVGNDDCDVAWARDHRVGPVGLALGASAPMRVDVGYDRQFALAANRPELGEGVAVEDADAALVGPGIELVVINGGLDLAPAVPLDTEKKDPGLVPVFAAAIELADDLAPVARRACQSVPRREPGPNSRFQRKGHEAAPGSR